MVRAPSATDSVRAAAHLFRMRWQSGVRCRARVLLSGKTEDYQGRMPGIIEEAVVAIALRQPIYVLGGFGGAAALLGELLGLASWIHSPVPLQPATALGLDTVAHLFRPTGFDELPLTTDDALSYLAGHAIGGPGWTDNGLTVAENRTLFALSGADADARKAAIELIERGLLLCSTSDGGRYRGSGRLLAPFSNSVHLIANGLHTARKLSMLRRTSASWSAP